MNCERCYRSTSEGEHGQYLCPLEPRQANGVIPDDIPGGIEIRHGLCNPDGSPRKYYSKTEIRREAARRGYTNHVEHIDGSKHTSRWI